MSKFDATFQDAMRRDNRSMEQLGTAFSMVTLLDDLYALIAAGSIGITAVASDVDSLALGGGHFTQDPATTSGLTFGYKAGRFLNGLILVDVGAGTIALSASATNYVEVDRAGTVSKNTSGFTSGRLPLWQIVTGVATITSVTIKKPLLQLLGTAGVVGSMLSTMGQTKEEHCQLGDLSATTSFTIIVPGNAGTSTKFAFVTKTVVAANDTNYWSIGVVNKGPAGAGTTVVVDGTAAANSTKATGGTAMAAYTPRNLTLTSTPADLVFAAGDVLEITFTKTAAATTMQQCALRFDSTFTG